MTSEGGPLRSLIWTFETATGSVRLNVGVHDETREDLYNELRGCAVVAEHLNEFVQLAARAIASRGGILADVLRQAPPLEPFDIAIRRIAETSDPFEAADRLVGLLEDSAAGRRRFLVDPKLRSARAYLNDLLVSLDEHGTTYGERIATLLGVTPDELGAVIGGP